MVLVRLRSSAPRAGECAFILLCTERNTQGLHPHQGRQLHPIPPENGSDLTRMGGGISTRGQGAAARSRVRWAGSPQSRLRPLLPASTSSADALGAGPAGIVRLGVALARRQPREAPARPPGGLVCPRRHVYTGSGPRSVLLYCPFAVVVLQGRNGNCVPRRTSIV